MGSKTTKLILLDSLLQEDQQLRFNLSPIRTRSPFCHSMSSQEILSSLRGKVLERPPRKISHGENQRPCEIQHDAWTPYNSNLQMQGIKVVAINPVPEVKKGDAFESTMLLIDMVRQQNENENKKKKEERIRELALEQKRKMEGKGNYSRNL